MTPSITIRLSEEELRDLKKHGRISDVVRRALRLYMQSESRRQAVKLREIQSSIKVRTTTEEDLRLLREDRERG